MIDSTTLDDLAARIGRLLDGTPARDVERNVKAILQGALERLDVVPRAEFDLQREVLKRTREKVEALEARLADLEARSAGDAPG